MLKIYRIDSFENDTLIVCSALDDAFVYKDIKWFRILQLIKFGFDLDQNTNHRKKSNLDKEFWLDFFQRMYTSLWLIQTIIYLRTIWYCNSLLTTTSLMITNTFISVMNIMHYQYYCASNRWYNEWYSIIYEHFISKNINFMI